MIVENFKVNRFGGHESVDFNCDSPVVGIFGPNGSGKSTLLEGLKFAITGETEASQENYVKDFKGSGRVNIRFRKNAKVGEIERNIGTKKDRHLDWDGRHITAAKDVTSTMANIFGADKKAVANAVFISQGKMAAMLFCGEAARRDAFVELLNLSFCAARADVLWRRIQKLQATMVDLTPARDAAQTQRESAAEVYLSKKNALEQMHPWSEEQQYLVTTQKIRNEMQIYQNQLNQAVADHQRRESELNGLLQKFNWESVTACEESLKAYQTQFKETDQQLKHKQSVWTELSHYDRVNKDISDIYKEMAGLQAKRFNADNTNAGLMEWMKRRGSVEEDEKQASRRKQVELQLAQEYKNSSAPGLKELPLLGFSQVDVTAYDQQIERLAASLTLHSKNLRIQKEIASCPMEQLGDGTVRCPKCDLTITDANRLSAGELAEMDRQERAMLQEKNDLVKLRNEKNQALEKHNQAVAVRTRMKQELDKRILALETELGSLPFLNLDVLKAEHDKIDTVITALREAETAEQAARRRLSAKLNERGGYKLAAEYITHRDDYCDAVIHELACQKEAAAKKIQETMSQFQLLHQTTREIDRLGKLEGTLALEVQNRIHQLDQPETEELKALRLEITDDTVVQAEVNARHAQWLELRAQVQQLEETYNTANAAFQNILERMQKDEQKRVLITELIELKELLSNDGLPLSYSRLQFEKLAEMTQANLAKLNANFAIEVDRSRDLAFTFRRLDRDSGVVLPMTSLSGGQKVRLCVAFLIAVQKQLVPDVGLLVLDEPTTSVDTEGRQEIADFLSNLGRELQTTEMQVWVCDHSAEVKDKIDCKIELAA